MFLSWTQLPSPSTVPNPWSFVSMSDVQLQLGWWLLRALLTYLMIREVSVFLLRCIVGRAEQLLQTWLGVPKEAIERVEESVKDVVHEGIDHVQAAAEGILEEALESDDEDTPIAPESGVGSVARKTTRVK